MNRGREEAGGEGLRLKREVEERGWERKVCKENGEKKIGVGIGRVKEGNEAGKIIVKRGRG